MSASELTIDIDDGEGKLSPPFRPDEYNFWSIHYIEGGNETIRFLGKNGENSVPCVLVAMAVMKEIEIKL